MKRNITLLLAAIILCACSSDKKNIEAFMQKYHPEYTVTGDQVTVDSAFCPVNTLDATAIEMMGLNAKLYSLYAEKPDSAIRYARQLHEKYGGTDVISNLTYPKGPRDRVTYTVKCQSDEGERLIVFYKDAKRDDIECCSLDADEHIDSIMSRYSQLMYNIGVILKNQDVSHSTENKDAETQG